jgi:protein subunit release factor A
MDARIIKLQEIEKRYLEISDLLMEEENVSDVKKYTKLSKDMGMGCLDKMVDMSAIEEIEEYLSVLQVLLPQEVEPNPLSPSS